jgi:thiazole synthase
MDLNSKLKINNLELSERLIIGSGKYANLEIAAACIEKSESQMITVAIRRIPPKKEGEPSLWDIIPKNMHILPNTAGCSTVEDCLRTAYLARELLGEEKGKLIKVEVIGDEKTLYPDVTGTIEATKKLVQEGFTCLPYISADPIACMKLIDVGASAIMPLAAPIGSGLGITNPYQLQVVIEVIRERSSLPIIVDAGVGTASDAAYAMELGVDAVLMNTAIACAKDPSLMASAMRDAVRSGRQAYLAGRMPMKLYASASSPIHGRIH